MAETRNAATAGEAAGTCRNISCALIWDGLPCGAGAWQKARERSAGDTMATGYFGLRIAVGGARTLVRLSSSSIPPRPRLVQGI